MPKAFIAALSLSLLLSVPSHAADIPEALKPWEGWVLYGQEEKMCPPAYNNGPSRTCVWPKDLALDLGASGGSFNLKVTLYAESWVALPGEPKLWPQDVTVKSVKQAVTLNNGRPALRLPAGDHLIQGTFAWERLPESLALPPASGLVHLVLDGTPVAFPDFRADRLWLQEQGADTTSAEDRLDLKVFRRIEDSVPMEVVTRIEIDVAGRQREVVIGPVLPVDAEGEMFIPVQVVSPVPGKLENDGSLRLQVRPGHWVVDVTARSTGVIGSLPVPDIGVPWPAEEVWVFNAHTDLRLVETGGLPAVDPRQTTLPEGWRDLPAFLAKPGETLTLKLVRQGDADPAMDQISINRTLWLDFNGGGYTVRDAIEGTMSRTHRLEASKELLLGRVTVSGEDMLITTRPGTDVNGVEVRRGHIDAVAASRIDGGVSRLKASGWEHDFTSASATLNTPPGWEVLAVTGVDNRPDTWLQKWTLLDLFLLLIISIAAFRLLGPVPGLVALAAVGLSWHTAFAPRTIWLHILVVVALLKYLPQGKLRRIAGAYRVLVFVLLIFMFIPFAVDQVRTALYPQLEKMPVGVALLGSPYKGSVVDQRYEPGVRSEGTLEKREMETKPSVSMLADTEPVPSDQLARKLTPYSSSELYRLPSSALLQKIDSGALVQTGPGLPGWRWNRISLSWNGPVSRSQDLRIYYLPPLGSSAVKVLRVLLVGFLGLLFAGLNLKSPGRFNFKLNPGVPGALVLLLVLLLVPSPARASEFPTPDLLQDLQNRLLEPPQCLPGCAQVSRLRLDADPGSLRMSMEVHTLDEVAVPLPCTASQWLPQTVLADDKPVGALFRSRDGVLWIKLDEGIHRVVMEGPLPGRSTVLIPLTLPVHQVTAKADGWAVDGIHENGTADDQLQLTRVKQDAALQMPALEAEALPPFVLVERSLLLGLEWRAQTTVRRLSPSGTAVVLEIPLLTGESVITDGVRVEDGKVLVNMGPSQARMTWESALKESEFIDLDAPDVTGWVESWRAEVSPIWNMEQIEGINVIHRPDPGGFWAPEWRPWPGESVRLRVTRPQAVPGSTFTIDTSQYFLKPGKKATDATLSFVARSSLGGQHVVTVPQSAELTGISIGGALQPIRPEGGKITLPVRPGRQVYDISWRLPEGIGMQYRPQQAGLGTDSVNQNIRVLMPRNRWVLLAGGPRLGPAVLFWSYIAVILLVAIGLGRTRLTPLAWWQWLLLGLGLTQVPLLGAGVIVGWLLVLGLRRKMPEDMAADRFNTVQILLAALTVMAAVALIAAIQKGLLGLPEMQVSGNGSTAYNLNWYADRVGSATAATWILSVPIYIYRLLMLAWALWLAFSLVGWVKWGWGSFTTGGYWKQTSSLVLPGFVPKKDKKKKAGDEAEVEWEKE